jgi:hypothetical protein
MQGHDLIILEEPQTLGFEAMLAGEFAIKEYLLHTEFEFPAYAAAQCRLLRGIHQKGFHIRHLHPWLDQLGLTMTYLRLATGLEILTPMVRPWRFISGKSSGPKKLIEFYQASAGGDFQRLTDAVTAFAKADAAKIRDMDMAHAEALGEVLQNNRRVYLEC